MSKQNNPDSWFHVRNQKRCQGNHTIDGFLNGLNGDEILDPMEA
jgi:hypothetical protein